MYLLRGCYRDFLYCRFSLFSFLAILLFAISFLCLGPPFCHTCPKKWRNSPAPNVLYDCHCPGTGTIIIIPCNLSHIPRRLLSLSNGTWRDIAYGSAAVVMARYQLTGNCRVPGAHCHRVVSFALPPFLPAHFPSVPAPSITTFPTAKTVRRRPMARKRSNAPGHCASNYSATLRHPPTRHPTACVSLLRVHDEFNVSRSGTFRSA